MKKGWKSFSPQKYIRQDSEGNGENGYPDPDSNKTKINYSKEPNEVHKKTQKEEILQVIRISQRCYWTWLTKTNRRHSRNYKTTKIKTMRRHKNK
jgi:hypothetical protein